MGDAHVSARGRAPETALLDPPSAWLYLVTAGAVLLGLWGRFKGLGTWSLNADEYYIARSVEDILRTGLPEYDCGGYYTRGLAFQYLAALLQWSGVSPEVSARLVAATSSVIALPAIYLLGRRLGGRTVGLLALATMALSAWEVDIARFGRMYAPFQAVFAWYLLYFLRATVDRDAGAIRPMLLLSVLGLFTWEGGVLLLAANLLPPFLRTPDGRLTRADLKHLGGSLLLLALGYYLSQMIDFRRIGTQAFPDGIDPDAFYVGEPEPTLFDLLQPTPLLLVVACALAVLALLSLRWAYGFRRRWPTALGLVVATGAALLHQFSLVVTITLVLLLAGMLAWRELRSRSAWPFLALVAASAVAWSALAVAHPAFLAAVEVPWRHDSTALALAYELFRLPDYLSVVALPWARQTPLLGALLSAGLAVAAVQVISRPPQRLTEMRVVLTLLACLLAAASLSDPPRYETRYVFFLYPTAVAVLIATLAGALGRSRLAARGSASSTAAVASAVLVVLLFGRDLDLRYLWNVASPTAMYAKDSMRRPPAVMRRSDTRSAAQWLHAHARLAGTFVVNGYPGVDFYFDGFDSAYIDSDHQRYWAYACNQGRTERWGNLPLISSPEDLEAQITAHARTFIVADTPALGELLPRLDALGPQVAWVSSDGRISIVEIFRDKGRG